MPYTELTAVWTGWPGAPGYSKFRFNSVLSGPDLDLCAAKVSALFTGIKTLYPSLITVTVQGQVRYYDDSAVLTGEAAITPPAPIVGGGGTTFSGGSGAVIDWLTNQFTGGRRIRGRTFFVPLSTAVYDSAGSIGPTQLATLATAAQNYIAGDPLPVIHSGRAGTPGTTAVVEQVVVPDLAAQLRSRRT